MWTKFLSEWDRRVRWRPAEQVVIHHDASLMGFGFYISGLPDNFDPSALPVGTGSGTGFAGLFVGDAKREVTTSGVIQWAEMFLILCSLALYAPYLQNHSVHLFTDNIADVYIINRQSTKDPRLLHLLKHIYLVCANNNIDIRADHVAGVDNTIADHLSRPSLHEHKACAPAHISQTPLHIRFIHSSSLTLNGTLTKFSLA